MVVDPAKAAAWVLQHGAFVAEVLGLAAGRCELGAYRARHSRAEDSLRALLDPTAAVRPLTLEELLSEFLGAQESPRINAVIEALATGRDKP